MHSLCIYMYIHAYTWVCAHALEELVKTLILPFFTNSIGLIAYGSMGPHNLNRLWNAVSIEL